MPQTTETFYYDLCIDCYWYRKDTEVCYCPEECTEFNQYFDR